MTDIKDIEQRAKDMIEQCQRRKVQRENAERERQELENRWSPYLEKVMRRYGAEFEDVLKE